MHMYLHQTCKAGQSGEEMLPAIRQGIRQTDSNGSKCFVNFMAPRCFYCIFPKLFIDGKLFAYNEMTGTVTEQQTTTATAAAEKHRIQDNSLIRCSNRVL